MDCTEREQIRGALIGFLTGDALGVPVEFLKRDSYPEVTGMRGYGTHNMPPGTWSDDGSMTLSMTESLVDGFNLTDIQRKFCDWLYRCHWTYNGKAVFDVGITTATALRKVELGIAEGETGEKGERDNGNGSLMRILPLAFYIAHACRKEEKRFSLIEEVSGITHAHIRSKIACSIYIEIALQLLDGKRLREAYEAMKPVIEQHYFKEKNEEERKHFSRILEDDLALLGREEIKSSGYVIDTLEASIWCLLTTDTYTDAVLKAVNLGEDTDTVGAVTGGIAGLYYGIEEIPEAWKRQLARIEDVEQLCIQFSESLKRI
ncbi:ADP-ribosylglycohydrolase family protein [Bacillus sp. 1P06AnD]|uniref:ADP-ribosylglycohydrolase family protein n=1 Tax=Bacillus sp. 1P06AnD TaxID=3132208 RepID=UPI0039A1993F